MSKFSSEVEELNRKVSSSEVNRQKADCFVNVCNHIIVRMSFTPVPLIY